MHLPRLRQLMESYFHQDYDLESEGDSAAILRDFVASSPSDQVEAVASELDRLLATPPDGLLTRFMQATGSGNMMIGDTDGEARTWLTEARAILAAARTTPRDTKLHRS